MEDHLNQESEEYHTKLGTFKSSKAYLDCLQKQSLTTSPTHDIQVFNKHTQVQPC